MLGELSSPLDKARPVQAKGAVVCCTPLFGANLVSLPQDDHVTHISDVKSFILG